MRSQTALKFVLILALLSGTGTALAVRLGAPVVRIAEQVGYVWVLAAVILLEPIATQFFPNRVPQIAIGVAVLSAAIGALCIVRYSTEHVALSLFFVSLFWRLSEDLLMQRSSLRMLNKTPHELYQHFKTSKPPTPLAKVLGRGSGVLWLAAIVCLFTITTW
jgi:hypothetical protein